MVTVFFLMAAACITYFAVIVAYSGITTSFCGIWMFLAALFVVMGLYAKMAGNEMEGDPMPNRMRYTVFTSFFLGLVVMAVIMVPVIVTAVRPPVPDNEYVIVLGAKVYDEGLSRSLKKRLDRAYEYYQEDPDAIFVLSGGKREDDSAAEAMSMYSYLRNLGIPEERLIIEMESENTAENIAFSGEQITADLDGLGRSTDPGDVKIGIISNSYHVFRSVSIARKMGMESATGIPSGSDKVLFIHNCVRECAAVVKDSLFGNMDPASSFSEAGRR